MPKLLFDESHGEDLKITSDEPNGISKLINGLKSQGYNIESIYRQSDFKYDVIRDADVLIISFPKIHFSDNEVKTILKFVRDNKGLFLTAEWGNIYENADILNKISQNFGVSFNYDRITDTRDIHEEEVKVLGETIHKEKMPQYAKIKEFSEHPITRGLKQIGYISGCSINAPEYTVLAWSDELSFGDLNGDAELDPEEIIGSFATAVQPTTRSGRVVCIGDTSILTNKYIDHYDNKKFILNIINWLSKRIE